MLQAEWAQTISTQEVPTSRDGCIFYPAHTVVFLFDLSTPSQHPAELAIEAVLQVNPDANWRLDFEAGIQTEPDGSGWANYGSVVHFGKIPLSVCQNSRWMKLR
jgi:hypothetical protein